MQYSKKDDLMRLYHDGFPEDSEEFVHYFFEHIYRENDAITKYNGNELIAGAHIVAKKMNYYGSIIDLPYLVAVSTMTEYRGQREIETVMSDALNILESRHMPYVALYPFKHSYYEKYGFVTVDKAHNIRKLADISGTLTETNDIDKLYEIFLEYERCHDISIHRDRDTMIARMNMLDVDHGKAYIIRDNDAICGYVMAYGEDIEELVVIDNSIVDIEYCDTNDNVMMRLVDVCTALREVPFDTQESTRRIIRLHDAFCGEKLVLLDVFEGEVLAKYIELPIYSIPIIDVSIEDLTLYTLGIKNVLGLPKIDRARISMIDKY